MSRRLDLIADVTAQVLAPEPAAIVLRAPVGSGTTHASQEVSDRVTARGVIVHVVAGSRTSHAVPYVSILPLLPPGSPVADTEVALVRQLGDVLRSIPRRLLVVDEISLIDPASAAIIERAVAAGHVDLVATDTTGSSAGRASRTSQWPAWSSVDIVELPPVDRQELVDLGHAWAPALHEDEVERAVAMSGGVPSVVRRLVARPEFIDDPAADPVLRDLVGLHLGPRTEAEHEIIGVLAALGPIPASLLRRLDGLAPERLAADGVTDGDPMRLRHPLHAAVCADTVAPDTFWELAVLAEDTTGVDVRFVAECTLRSGRAVPPELARRGAESARTVGRIDLARRLLATIREPHCADLVARSAAEARSEHLDQAIATAREATAIADTAEHLVDASIALADLLYLQRRDHDDAMRVLETCRTAVSEPAQRDRIDAVIALFERVRGNPSPHSPSPISTLDRCVEHSFGAVLAGGIRAGIADAEAARATLTDDSPLDSVAAARLELTVALGALHAGDIARSERIVDQQLAAALDGPIPPGSVGWLTHGSETRRLAGRFDEAERLARRAVEASNGVDDLGLRGFTIAELGSLAAESGRLDEARRLLAQVEPSDDVRTRARCQRGVVRLADPDRTDALAAASAQRLIDQGVAIWAIWVAYEAVRCGPAPRSASVLESLVGVVDGPLVGALAEHAMASHERDAAAIGRAGDRLVDLGFSLIALDAFADECLLHQYHGDSRICRRRLARATSVCSAVASAHRLPAIDRLRLVGAASESLTERQMAIARRAAQGVSSRDISAELAISIRTVDNHLAAVYRKLAISGRVELGALLMVAA